MEADKGNASEYPNLGYPWLQLLYGWSVVCLVLLSMTIQAVLVFGGTIRYRSGSRLLNFVIWVCYMGADFVATSALGSMIHYDTREVVYVIWASMLMVHLGGPDTITAYSIPDTNLWKRHCFSLLYQGSIAAYVVYVSAVEGEAEMEWYLLGAACLIFIVGITKYAERIRALWLASPPQIVRSVMPIYNYMKIEHALGLDVNPHIPDDEIADVDQFIRLHESKVAYSKYQYQYIVAGEESFDEDDINGDWSDSIVTTTDVLEYEGDVVTDNYMLCVSHALYKMYKRRFASLRFHEATLEKTTRFFNGHFNRGQVCRIVEIELKFLYDYLFSKSSGTAFSGWGVGMRVVNMCLLGCCWFLIMRGLQETQHVLQGQRAVTYILMCVAVGLEGFQLGRIILSDWSMVWLICANVRHSRKESQRWWGSCNAKLMHALAKAVGRVRKAVGGKYWRDQVPQLCVMETCFSARSYSYPLIRKVLGFLPLKDFIMTCYISAVTAWHIKREVASDDIKRSSVFYLGGYDDARDNLRGVKRMLEEELEVEEEGVAVGLEHRILAMHVATAVCDKLHESKVDDDVRWVSRYMAYLVVTCPEMLPVEAESTRTLYREVFGEMMGENGTLDDFCRNNFKHSQFKSLPLRMAKTLLTKWEQQSGARYWYDKWIDTLFLCGVYDKSAVHGERLTVGGEFLTHKWVFWGHMGRADESYSPTAMVRDPRQFQE